MEKRRKTIILVVAIVLILVVVGVGVWMITGEKEPSHRDNYTNEDDTQNKEESKDSQTEDKDKNEDDKTLENKVVHNKVKYEYNDHLSNYLFLGIDRTEPVTQYEVRGGSGQSDAIYLVSHDRVKNTIKVLSIPRDSIVEIHTFSPAGTDLGYSQNHLSIQYAFGDGKDESCRLTKEAVSKLLYNIPIQGYCSVNMEAIPVIAEALGGVEVTVPNNSLEANYPEFKEGATVTITKSNAETFVRYRDIMVAHSAITRMERQKVFLKASADKAKSLVEKDANLIARVYESLQPYMVTNMGNDIFAKLSQTTFDSTYKIQDVPGEKVEGERYDEYHVDKDKLYELLLQMFYEEVQDK